MGSGKKVKGEGEMKHKDRRLEIRISDDDLEALRRIAKERGLEDNLSAALRSLIRIADRQLED